MAPWSSPVPSPLATENPTPNESGRPQGRGVALWLTPVLVLAAVLGGVLATYGRALAARAQYMDDKFYLGPLIRHPSWGALKTIFGEVLAPSLVNGYYQPLAQVSIMLDFLDPAAASSLVPFHRTALLLHLLNVALIVVLLHRLFGNWLGAGLLGLLYGVHPLNADAVLWVAERKTVLSTAFALASLLFYLAYVRRAAETGGRAWKSYGAALLAYACALLSKPTALPVVALLLVLDYWPLARLGRRTLLEKVPFLVLAMLSGGVALASQVHSGQGGTMEYVKYSYLPLTVLYGVGFYLLKVVWPAGLVSDYPYPSPLGLSNPEVLGCAIIALGAGVAIALSVRRTRAYLAGGLFLLVAIFPTLGLIRFTSAITTNRSMYLPMVGILLPLQWQLTGWWRHGIGALKLGRRALRVTVLGLGVALAVAGALATLRYEAHWSDTLTLLRYYLGEQPRDWRLHTRMGNEWIARGDHRSALQEFRIAVSLNQSWTENHLNVGRAAFTLGDYAEAAQAFTTALAQTPRDWRAHMLMGMTRERQGSLEDAMQEFQTAARLAPRAAMPHFKIATILGQQGRRAEAVEEYEQTLLREPGHAEARMALDALRAGASQPP